MAKKKKRAAKKVAKSKRAGNGARRAKSRKRTGDASDVDLKSLSPADLKNRVDAIYKLERKVEAKRDLYLASKAATKAYKVELKAAEDALEKEIRDQRIGPGPLFPDGV